MNETLNPSLQLTCRSRALWHPWDACLRLLQAAEFKRSAALMKSLAALALLVLTTIASLGASAPDLKIQDAIAAADAYLATTLTKYIPSGFYVSSAVLTKETDGRKTWHVQYDPIKAVPLKDPWFVVVVEMDKRCSISEQK